MCFLKYRLSFRTGDQKSWWSLCGLSLPHLCFLRALVPSTLKQFFSLYWCHQKRILINSMKSDLPRWSKNIQPFNLFKNSFLGWTGQWPSSSRFRQSPYWNPGWKQSESVFHNAQLPRLYPRIRPCGSNYLRQSELDLPSENRGSRQGHRRCKLNINVSLVNTSHYIYFNRNFDKDITTGAME